MEALSVYVTDRPAALVRGLTPDAGIDHSETGRIWLMVLQSAVSAHLATDKNFRKIQGYRVTSGCLKRSL